MRWNAPAEHAPCTNGGADASPRKGFFFARRDSPVSNRPRILMDARKMDRTLERALAMEDAWNNEQENQEIRRLYAEARMIVRRDESER